MFKKKTQIQEDKSSNLPKPDIGKQADEQAFKRASLPTSSAMSKEQEYLIGWQRAQADYQNLLKETDKRMSEFRKYAQTDLLEQLFPLTDYFNSAFEQAPKDADEKWIQGFKYIQDYFNKILTDNGAELIEVIGKQFDPELHECIKEENCDEKPNTIIKQVQAGYILNGKVIRPAKVVVAKKQDEETSDINK
ncbi:MAG: nucleotide exchange factor GrpE [Patescibacteria group bacterium]